jgi:predicted O-linked N-acetylglucosamine transferase (SPINDLY family)
MTPDQLQMILQKGIGAFQTGNEVLAENLLKQVLRLKNDEVVALSVLGFIKINQKRNDEAIYYLKKASKISPNEPSIRYNLAKILLESGYAQESIIHHQILVDLSPTNANAWLNFGTALYQVNSYEKALHCFDSALHHNKNLLEAKINRVSTLISLKKTKEALIDLEILLSTNPPSNILILIGLAYDELEFYDKAESVFKTALSLDANDPLIYISLGNCYFKQRHYKSAIDNYNGALSIDKNCHDALLNKGICFNRLKVFDEAIEQFNNALSIDAYSAETYINLADSYYQLNIYDKAIINFQKALKINPNINWAIGGLLHSIMKVSDWSKLSEYLSILVKGINNEEKVCNPFELIALIDDPALQKKNAQIYSNHHFPENFILGPITNKKIHNRIKIGYFSSDFREHAVGFLTAELFELHDKEKFEIYGFSYGPNDNSQTRIRLEKAFEHFIEVDLYSDLEIANMVRQYEIDIAVDLNGHTELARTKIFSYRCAPIQMSYLGYLGTMGTSYHDYLIADKILIPDNFKKFYDEKIVYLPSYQANDSQRKKSDVIFTKESLGIDSKNFVFCCFNSNYKLTPTVFESWIKILHSCKDSVLLVFAANQQICDNLIRVLDFKKIDKKRVFFLNQLTYDQYLSRYEICDLFLDTYPYNAGTTASDALWSGIPVLTMAGKSFASRMGASVLSSLELYELITYDVDQYVKKAIDLANNPDEFKFLKNKLLRNKENSILFNTSIFTKNIEIAFQKLYNNYVNDLNLDDLIV